MTFSSRIDLVDPSNAGGATADAVLVRDLQQALNIWSSYISGAGTLIVELDIANTAENRASGGPTSSEFVGTNNGLNVFEASSFYELKTGLHVTGTTSDIKIEVSPSYITSLNLDPNITPLTTSSNFVNPISLFLHELEHGFGMDGWYSQTGVRYGSESPFDEFIQIRSDGTAYFIGANAERAYGGPVPLTTGSPFGENYYHFGNQVSDYNASPSTVRDPLTLDLMNGIVYFTYQAYTISVLDVALLKDLGYSITATDPSPITIVGTVANQTISDVASVRPFGSVSISDPNANQIESITVTLSTAANGVLSNLSGGTYTAATGVYTVSGTVAGVTAALDGLVFTPAGSLPGQNRTTGFAITDTDTSGTTVTDTVTSVIAAGPAGTPVADDDAYITSQNTALGIAASSGVLANDILANAGSPQTLTGRLSAAPKHGAVMLNADGSFTYTPVNGFVGNDSFSYTASNRSLTSSASTVSIAVINTDFTPMLGLTDADQLITEVFIGYFNRAPDPAGLSYWMNKYNIPSSNNPFFQDVIAIASSFADPKQAETVALYPFLANPGASTFSDVTRFVTDAYSKLFNRTVTGTDIGVEYWASSIAKSLGIAVPVFGDSTLDHTAPITAANALIAIINGAQHADAATIADKVVVSGYYDESLKNSGSPFTQASSHVALSGVTSNSASVLTAESTINAYAYNPVIIANAPGSSPTTQSDAPTTAIVSADFTPPVLGFIAPSDAIVLGSDPTAVNVTLGVDTETITNFHYDIDQLNIDLMGAPNGLLATFDMTIAGAHAVALASGADPSRQILLLNMPAGDTAADLIARHVTFNGGHAIVG